MSVPVITPVAAGLAKLKVVMAFSLFAAAVTVTIVDSRS